MNSETDRKKPSIKSMRSNSVNESLAKVLIALYGSFFEDSVEMSWAIAQGSASTDPKLFDALLVALREICSVNTPDGFMKKAIISEVKGTAKYQQLFRGRSVAMRMMCAIYKVDGQMYMHHCLTGLFEAAAELDHEVKIGAPPVSPAMYKEFEEIAQPFLDTVWGSAGMFPKAISNIINFSKLISEDMFPGNGAKIALINFVFLRFFSAVVVSPASFGFETPKPIPQFGTTFLMSLSKALSTLANSLFSETPDNSPFAPLIKRNADKCLAFLQEISKECVVEDVQERKTMTLPDGTPVVPKNVRDALKVILNEIETNYPRIVWTLKDFSFIADRLYNVLKIKGVKQLKTPKAILQEPKDLTKLTTKVDEKFIVINTTTEAPKEPLKAPESVLSEEEARLRIDAHKKLDDILLYYTKGTQEAMASMKKEIEQEHSMRVRAEQEVQTLQSENEALHKKIETLKEKLAAAQATPLSPTQPPQPSPFSKGFQAAEAHKDGAQRPMFQMGRTRILKQQRQSSPPQQPPSQQQQQQVSPSSSPSLPQQ